MSMTLVRSSPVTVTVPGEPPLPACTSTLVMTPSNSGCGVPLRVTTSITRSGGVADRGALPGGDQEDRVELGLGRELERQLKSARRAGGRRHLDAVERVHHHPRRREGDDRPHEQRELDALSQHRSLPVRLRASVIRRRRPAVSVSSAGLHRAIGIADAPVLQRIAEVTAPRDCRGGRRRRRHARCSRAKFSGGGTKRRRRKAMVVPSGSVSCAAAMP